MAVGLAITFFWLGGYSVAYTYLSPYLLNVTHIGSGILSTLLLIFGVASLAGSKAGGFSADKWGARMTLIGGMALHAIMLMLLPFVTHSAFGAAAVLIFCPSQPGHLGLLSSIIWQRWSLNHRVYYLASTSL